MRLQKNVSYWQGVIDPTRLIDDEQHGAVIRAKLEMLAQGCSQSANLDLKSNGIYGIRLNKKHRLFVITYHYGGQSCLLLLGVDTEHNYKKNVFFRPRGLANFIEKHLVYADPKIQPLQHFIEEVVGGVSVAPQPPVFELFDEFHQVGADPYVMLTEKQADIATRAVLPVVVRGVAGSGKTLSVMLLMANQASILAGSVQAGARQPIVRLVCKSGALANKTEHDFYAANPEGVAGVKVEFKAYASLYQGDAQPVDFTHFEKWLKVVSFVRKQKGISKYSAINKSVEVIAKHCFELQYIDKKNPNIARVIYNEFKIVACNAEAYCDHAFGKRQCRMQILEAKKAVVTIFNAYLQNLTKPGMPKIDFNIMVFEMPEELHCDALIVEEGQLVTGKMLETMLLALKNKRQVLMSCDTHQATTDILSLNMHLVRQNFIKFGYGGDIAEICLDESFRISSHVAQMADNALVSMNQVIDGVTEAGLYTSVKMPIAESVASGHVVWIKDEAQTDQKRLQRLASQPTTLVVAADAEHCEQAREQWGEHINVQSAYDCGGLEYSTVIIHSLPKIKLKRKTMAQSANEGKKASRPKDFLAPFRYEQEILLWRLLYTMTTRSSDQLVVLGKHPMYGVFEAYQEAAENQIRIKPLSPKQEMQAWLTIVKDDLYEGRADLACQKYAIHKLHLLTDCDFEVFQYQCFPELVKPINEETGFVKAPAADVDPKKKEGGVTKAMTVQNVTPTLPLPLELKHSGGRRKKPKAKRGKSKPHKTNVSQAEVVKAAPLNYVVEYKVKRKTCSVNFSMAMGKKDLKQLNKPPKELLKKICSHHVLALLSLHHFEESDRLLGRICGKDPMEIVQSFLKKKLDCLIGLEKSDIALPKTYKVNSSSIFFSLITCYANFEFFYEPLGQASTIALLSLFCAQYDSSNIADNIPMEVNVIRFMLSHGYYDFVDAWMAHNQFTDDIFNKPKWFNCMTEHAEPEDLKYALEKVSETDSLLSGDFPPLKCVFHRARRNFPENAEIMLQHISRWSNKLDRSQYLNLAIEYGLLGAVKHLVEEKGADINTSIKQALKSTTVEVLQYLIDAKANIHDKSGLYLCNVIKDVQGSENIQKKLDILLMAKADPNWQPTDPLTLDNWCPLREAAKSGQSDVVALLLAHKARVMPDKNHAQSPLTLAIERRHEPIVKQLLEANALLDNSQQILLDLLQAHQKQYGILKLLLDAKAAINECDVFYPDTQVRRRSYLGTAVYYDDIKALQLLVTAKANINRAPDNKKIVTNAWSSRLKPEILPLLCDAGFNVNQPLRQAKNRAMFNLLNQAVSQGDMDGMKLLFACKADPNGEECEPPIFDALEFQQASPEFCQQLINAKADVNIKNQRGQTALDMAVNQGHKKMVQILMSVNAQASMSAIGFSAMMSVISRRGGFFNSEPDLSLLLYAKADPNQREVGSDSRVPLCVAIQQDNLGAAELLLQAKADPHLSGPSQSLLEYALWSVAQKFQTSTTKHYFDERLSDLVGIVQLLIQAKVNPGQAIKGANGDARYTLNKIQGMQKSTSIKKFTDAMHLRFNRLEKSKVGGQSEAKATVSGDSRGP